MKNMENTSVKKWLKFVKKGLLLVTAISLLVNLSQVTAFAGDGQVKVALMTNDIKESLAKYGIQTGISSQNPPETTEPPETTKKLEFSKIAYNNKTLEFCINTDAYVTTGFYESTDNGNKTIKIVSDNELKTANCYSYIWDGKNSNGETASQNENIFYWIKAVNKASSTDEISSAGWMQYSSYDDKYDDENENLIKNLQTNKEKLDPTENENVKISFDLTKDAEKLEVKIYKSNTNELVRTLKNSGKADKDEYHYFWDGKDDDEKTVKDGEYSIKVKAKTKKDGKDSDTINVKVKKGSADETINARIKNVFSTKDSFDPLAGEKTYIIFTITSDSEVKIEILDKNGEKLEEIFDKKYMEAGTYSVEWSPKSTIAYGNTYTYEITVKNSKNTATARGEIRLEEDDEISKRANIYKDEVSPAIFNPNKSNGIKFGFKLSKDAKITLMIYNDGEKVATVVKDKEMEKGTNEIVYDGGGLTDGIYDYKIFATTDGGEAKEFGKFMIEKTGAKSSDEEFCAGFSDVKENHVYCEVIIWAKSVKIFEGYYDNTFRPYQTISRVEALKTIMISLGYEIMPYYGEDLGFKDVHYGAWYMPYIKTAKALGIAEGYGKGIFNPEKRVTKAEALVMALRAFSVKNFYRTIPDCGIKPYADVKVGTWYTNEVCYAKESGIMEEYGIYFYPDDEFVRGEMAKLLYNMSVLIY